MVCKPDGRAFGETIVEAFEKISFVKDIGVIDNHDSCFAEGGATGETTSVLGVRISLIANKRNPPQPRALN